VTAIEDYRGDYDLQEQSVLLRAANRGDAGLPAEGDSTQGSDCRLDSSQYPSETTYLRLGIEAAHCTFVRRVGLIIYSLLPAPIALKTAQFLADQALGRY
jgi:hypothetical protein